MSHFKPPSTPISPSKSAAMTRVIDLVSKGYRHATAGECPVERLPRMVAKFHERYGIGLTPAQVFYRKQRGLANAKLVVFRPLRDDSLLRAQWLLLATPGQGLIHEVESLRSVMEAPYLNWLGYELVRQTKPGGLTWTWRRPKLAMAECYAELDAYLKQHATDKIALCLARFANQPGFAGVRMQSFALFEYAKRHGYLGEVPYIPYMEKIAHGEPMLITVASDTGQRGK